ncbi:MAG: AbrB/MazE/SpoVT family DNA-binding domain-containing protein [Candidatus Thermoplasmatota archaeon]|nr:AbrB/MazE/SpoVT family DNA-binding domain-containing protein [Candidatus Thermoplasmatota archaeon]
MFEEAVKSTSFSCGIHGLPSTKFRISHIWIPKELSINIGYTHNDRMERKMKVGPKGQIVIPKEIRDKLGMKEFSEVLVDLKGEQVVISKAGPQSISYTEFFVSTYGRKLKQKVDLGKIMDEEYERNLLR